MKIYLVRHGETQWNFVKKIQGITDIPLNEYGRELAQKTAIGLAHIPFTKIISSPLDRALETAKIITSTRDLPIITDKRIQEISFGEYEGLVFKGPDRNVVDNNIDVFFTNPEAYVCPKDGESILSLQERTKSFITDLIEDASLEKDTILITSHGAAIRGMLSAIKQTPISRFWEGGVHQNCAVTLIEVVDQTPVILEEGRIYY